MPYTLLLSVVEYKTLVLRGDMETAAGVLESIPQARQQPGGRSNAACQPAAPCLPLLPPVGARRRGVRLHGVVGPAARARNPCVRPCA